MLGVQTHFSQGWRASSIDRAREVGAGFLRDSLPWARAERSPGRYDFSGSAATKISAACEAGFDIVLTQVARNPLYDAGETVHSPEAQAAFGTYLRHILEQYGDCIIAFEIGNELNGPRGFGFSEGHDPLASYVDMLEAVDRAIGQHGENVAILGGSTNMIGTGFLASLLDAGMGDYVDGVAVHPYARHGDTLDIELENLRAVMRESGAVIPIWVTEYSHDLDDDEEAAARMLKSVVLMASTDVEAIGWYALDEQRWFPNLRLFSGGRRTAQGDAFALLAGELLPSGRPERVDFGDPGLFAFRLGRSAWVVWGTPRQVVVPAGASFRDARGSPIAYATSVPIGDSPLVILNAPTIEPGPSGIYVDSLLDWGRGPIEYLVRHSGDDYRPLSLRDGKFDSQYWDPEFRPLRIGGFTAAPGGTGRNPFIAVWRFETSGSGRQFFSACLAKADRGDGVDFAVLHDRDVIVSGVLTNGTQQIEAVFDAGAGDQIELQVGPNATFGGDSFSYRFIAGEISARRPATCP